MRKPIKLVYLVSHPIYYQAPFLRLLEEDPNVDLLVLFRSDYSLSSHNDAGFGCAVKWDVPIDEGYKYKVLPCLGGNEKFGFAKPLNYGLKKALKDFGADVLWVHGYASLFDVYAIFLAKSMGLKVMVRGESNLFSLATSPLKKKIRKGFFWWLNRKVDAFLTVGSANAEFYKHFGVPGEKLFLAPYAVDNEFFQNKASAGEKEVEKISSELGLKEGFPIVLYVSKLQRRKNPDLLIEAFSRVSSDGKKAPEAYLLFVGDGEMRQELEEMVSSLGWNNIKFLGFKNQSELPYYLKLADIFVLPSEREPWGLVVNEAMNVDCAMLVSDQVGSGFDLVKNGENGFVVRANDLDGLGDKLKYLIGSPEEIDRMKGCSVDIISKWGIAETAAGVINACRKVLQK